MPRQQNKSKKIKKQDQKAIDKLLNRKVPKYQIVSPELASELAELAYRTQIIISLLIDRNGKVRAYYLGDLKNIKEIKAQAAREKIGTLAQLRFITANPHQDNLAEAELLLMKRYNLDLLLFVKADENGEFSRKQGQSLAYADYGQITHLSTGDEPWTITEPDTIRNISEIDLEEFITSVEEDIAQLENTVKVKDREIALLVGTSSGDSFAELRGLATTAGAEIAYELKQNLKKPDPRYHIGSGKVQELALLVEKHYADLVIFDTDLSPAQARNIERELGSKTKVLDRTELILDIFAQRARSREGKLQVELAQLKYLAPRLAGGYQALSKLGGGIGTRGPGETQLEMERRRINDRITYLQNKVNEISQTRGVQRKQRQSQGIPLISLVGYTNAGKSTLFRSLTGSEVYVEDQLFATLDPTIRKVNLDGDRSFLLSDTVGFIQNLPTTLVNAFKATLEEIEESDLLIITLDTAHPNRSEHLTVIRDILEQLSMNEAPQLLAFNKIDQISDEELSILKQEFPEAIFISAIENINLEELLERVWERIT